MAVAEDGSFTGEVQLVEGTNTVTAVATWDGEEDRWQMMTEPHPEGGLIVIPGLGSGFHLYEERVLIDEPVTIRPGETKSVDITVESGKMDLEYPSQYSCGIADIRYRATTQDKYDMIPSPQRFQVGVEPQRLTEYANTTYHLTLTLKAGDELEPGEYLVELDCRGAYIAVSTVTINVEP